MRERIDEKPRSDEFPRAQIVPRIRQRSMAEVISAVASVLRVSEDHIRYGRGGEARVMAAWLGQNEADLDLRLCVAILQDVEKVKRKGLTP